MAKRGKRQETTVRDITEKGLAGLNEYLDMIKPLLKNEKERPNPLWGAEYRDTVRRITETSKEMRQQDKNAASQLASMTLDERIEVLCGWFDDLSPQKQRSLLQRLMSQYNENNPGKESAG